MKEAIISGSIFLFFALLCLTSIKNTEKITNFLVETVSTCESKVESGDWSAAVAETKKAREFFVEKTYVLESYLLHDDIERLSDILTDIEVSVITRNKTSAISAIRIFKRRLEELSEDDKLSLNNIF